MPKLPPAQLPMEAPSTVGMTPSPADLVDIEVEDAPPAPTTPVDEDGYELVENEDGSVDVFDKLEEPPEPSYFEENLADLLDSSYLNTLGSDLKELIDMDIKSREKRDEQYEKGIQRTGLGNDSPGGADFEGSTKAVHPMLAKGCVDFASRAVKELMPASGPCKVQIVGEQTEEALEKAERKKKYMNWQLMTQIEENRPEFEKMLSQVPLGGAQYKRWWWDKELRRPRTEAVFIDDVFTPYGSADFYTSPRISYRQRITRLEYDARVRTGLYRDVAPDSDNSAGLTDASKSSVATDKVTGSDDDSQIYNEDGVRTVWQIEITHDELGDDMVDRPAPYIIHLDDSTEKILGYFRNWKEDDERMRKKNWMSEWPFIPWRGGPAVGLAHLIGSLAGAATGALRAILDTAHINNFPGAIKLAGTRGAGETKSVSPTEITSIDAPAGTDDIRKVIMPFPFNGPSPVLFQMMEWLTQQAEIVVATASEKIADGGSDMPVGTALALIEHGSTNFSAVHTRLHAALKRDLEILHRLNAENMADEETIEDLGSLVVKRDDFLGPMDVQPVSDPNIFSEAQRYAQLQAVIQLKSDPEFAQYFKADQLLSRALKLLNIPDIEGIANLPKETRRLSPLDENYAVSLNERPLRVYQDQNDLVHLKAHIQFATSPMFGANPLIASGIMAPMLQHCKEHLMSLYRKHVRAASEQFQLMARARNIPMEDDAAQLHGAAFADQLLAEILGPMVMPGLEQMQKIVGEISAASAPKPSPEIALMEATKKDLGMADIASKEKIAQGNIDFKKALEQFTAMQDDKDRDQQERLAQLASSIQMVRDQQSQGATQALNEFKAQHETHLTVLTTVLDNALAGMQKAAGEAGGKTNVMLPNGMDLATELVNPLIGDIQATLKEAITGINSAGSPVEQAIVGLAAQQQNLQSILRQQSEMNSAVFTQLTQTVAELQADAQSERHAELVVDPTTGRKMARLVKTPPQPQLPPPQGPAQ